ncbi:MAG: sigma-70 family RNA polymerase sigma factor [Actinomycetia bacterium]|nr:sigma-70 family RNA polymerase sigma factor [Actinomycetes bacterium]
MTDQRLVESDEPTTESSSSGLGGDFDSFFKASYTGTVNGLIRNGYSQEVAADSAQEAFVRAYARWWRISHYREPVAWVRRVAVNLAIDSHRNGLRQQDLLPRLAPPVLAMTDDGVGTRVADDGFDELLSDLSPQQRRAVEHYYGDDLDTETGAAAMGISPGAFRFHLSRARSSLRTRLTPTTEVSS